MSIQRLNAPLAARIGWTASHSAAECSLEAMAGKSWGYEDHGLEYGYPLVNVYIAIGILWIFPIL